MEVLSSVPEPHAAPLQSDTPGNKTESSKHLPAVSPAMISTGGTPMSSGKPEEEEDETPSPQESNKGQSEAGWSPAQVRFFISFDHILRGIYI